MLQIFEEREEVIERFWGVLGGWDGMGYTMGMWKSGKGATTRAPVGANNVRLQKYILNVESTLLSLGTYEIIPYWQNANFNKTIYHHIFAGHLAQKNTHIHAYTHSRMHARTHARTHARMHACTPPCHLALYWYSIVMHWNQLSSFVMFILIVWHCRVQHNNNNNHFHSSLLILGLSCILYVAVQATQIINFKLKGEHGKKREPDFKIGLKPTQKC